jgi:hydrogenase nickel incorporation protein HypB
MQRLPLKSKVLSENQRIADSLRERFAAHGTLVLNLISSPGSGKTALLERTLEQLDPGIRAAVLTGDIQTDNDARRLARFGFPVRQISNGGICHLDGQMIERHLDSWNLDELDLLFIENVGNLVCPASYDLGEAVKIVLLSVTEGEDKPLKYPSIFFKSDLFLLTKIDLLPYVPFNAEQAEVNARLVHPGIEILRASSTAPGGLDAWMHWLDARLARQPSTVAAAR